MSVRIEGLNDIMAKLTKLDNDIRDNLGELALSGAQEIKDYADHRMRTSPRTGKYHAGWPNHGRGDPPAISSAAGQFPQVQWGDLWRSFRVGAWNRTKTMGRGFFSVGEGLPNPRLPIWLEHGFDNKWTGTHVEARPFVQPTYDASKPAVRYAIKKKLDGIIARSVRGL